METRKTGYLMAVISSIVIIMACIVSPSSTYGEELILVHFDSWKGDIKKVEYRSDKDMIIVQEPLSFSRVRGFKIKGSFQHSMLDFMNSGGENQVCCKIFGVCSPVCEDGRNVIAAYRYDRQRNELEFHSLNSMSREGQLSQLDIMPFKHADLDLVKMPKTRNYHLAVVKSDKEVEVRVIDEIYKKVWTLNIRSKK